MIASIVTLALVFITAIVIWQLVAYVATFDPDDYERKRQRRLGLRRVETLDDARHEMPVELRREMWDWEASRAKRHVLDEQRP